MSIEKSHGKARPTLPRASDLNDTAITRTADQRPRQRDKSGRFVPGNQASLGRGAKAGVRRLLGRGLNLTDADALVVARDADRLFGATMAELPHDGPTVRQLAALYARHVALTGYWSTKASEAGLGSDNGIKAQEHATKHGQRAERVAVTMLDVAKTFANAKDTAPVDHAAIWAAVEASAVPYK